MKISTKGRYALRLMIDLAQNKNTGNISLKDISKRQDISLKYLEQIASPLSKSGLIRSVRGSQGGYFLTKDPTQYTAKEIIEAIEGPIACVSCLETPTNICPRYPQCPTVSFYQGLNKVIIQYLESYTLDDLATLNQKEFDFII